MRTERRQEKEKRDCDESQLIEEQAREQGRQRALALLRERQGCSLTLEEYLLLFPNACPQCGGRDYVWWAWSEFPGWKQQDWKEGVDSMDHFREQYCSRCEKPEIRDKAESSGQTRIESPYFMDFDTSRIPDWPCVLPFVSAERVRQLTKIANGEWRSLFQRYYYPDQLRAIGELGASGSPEALIFLKRIAEPSIRMETVSRNDPSGPNPPDCISIDVVQKECVDFRNARGQRRKKLAYKLTHLQGEGPNECSFSSEQIEAARALVLSKDPHRAIASAIAALENSHALKSNK